MDFPEDRGLPENAEEAAAGLMQLREDEEENEEEPAVPMPFSELSPAAQLELGKAMGAIQRVQAAVETQLDITGKYYVWTPDDDDRLALEKKTTTAVMTTAVRMEGTTAKMTVTVMIAAAMKTKQPSHLSLHFSYQPEANETKQSSFRQ
jgi:hypothetical protein